ncbi:MAG: TIGR04283 family arsenosugar biosynthesis glycosyltransferase [Chthoniobacterales bacterium]
MKVRGRQRSVVGVAAPEGAVATEDATSGISIIVPVFNESAGIQVFLKTLRSRAPGAEIIVVDGGSSDATRPLVELLCDHLVTSSRGRALQMNAGARAANGEVLWFLHADVEPPVGCLEAIENALENADAVGGYFRIRLPRRRLVYRLSDEFAHYAGKLMRVRCGDHGFFCRRAVFEQIGGFGEGPLMEDVELFRAMMRCGEVAVIEKRLVVSPRRYQALGPMRLTLAFGLIASLYALHTPWPVLAALYRRLCVPR